MALVLVGTVLIPPPFFSGLASVIWKCLFHRVSIQVQLEKLPDSGLGAATSDNAK